MIKPIDAQTFNAACFMLSRALGETSKLERARGGASRRRLLRSRAGS